jgi:DNA-binding IclR family transcriptional regulator
VALSFRHVKRVSPEETGAHTTRTVERACAVLAAFSSERPRLSLSELAARVELPKATVHRLAGELVANGFLEHRDDGRYSLGFKLAELGMVARAELDVVNACGPVMDALAEATHETVILCAVDWDTLELTILRTRVSPQALSVVLATGQRQPLAPGAPVKAVLAALAPDEADHVLDRLPLSAGASENPRDRARLAREIERARATGFAVAEDEFMEGVSGVAVPVLFEEGRPRATIGVAGPTARMAERFDEIGQLVVELTSTLRPTPVLEVA